MKPYNFNLPKVHSLPTNCLCVKGIYKIIFTKRKIRNDSYRLPKLIVTPVPLLKS